MKKTLAVLTVFLFAFAAIAQEKKQTPLPSTYFSFLPIGELPPMVIKKSERAGSFSIAEIPANLKPPQVLFYENDFGEEKDKEKSNKSKNTQGEKDQKKEEYKSVGLSFNCTTPWLKNEKGKRSFELLSLTSSKDGVNTYKKYLSTVLPEASSGALVILYSNTRTWESPIQMAVPIEGFYNLDYTKKDAVLMVNLLDQPLQFKMDGKKGILRAGARTFVPISNTGKSIQFTFLIMKDGKLIDIGTSSFTPMKASVPMFFAYKNFYARKGSTQEKISRCSFDLPRLAPPEAAK